MELNFTHHYDGPAERVVELMRTKEFIDDVATHAGAQSHSVHVEDGVTHLDMTLAAPPSIAKVVGGSIRLTQVMSWGEPDANGTRRGNIDVDVAGAPVKVNAGGVLKALSDSSSQADFTGELNVRIPLLGKKIEAQVAPMIQQAFAGIERRANAWLAKG